MPVLQLVWQLTFINIENEIENYFLKEDYIFNPNIVSWQLFMW